MSALPAPTFPDGSLNTAFDPGAGADTPISIAALQPDGKVLVGGSFAQFAGLPRYGLARVNSDGSLDADFRPRLSEIRGVSAIAVQPDGNILAAGYFTERDGQTHHNLIRLKADGRLDRAFAAGDDARNTIHSLALETDGKVIVGSQSSFNHHGKKSIVRLNPNGAIDKNFDRAGGLGVETFALALQTDGKVITFGISYGFALDFVVAVSRIGSIKIVLPPVIDPVPPGLKVVRLNGDGTIDDSFTADIPAKLTPSIEAAVSQPDGKLIVAGEVIGGVTRLEADGSTDATFNVGSGADGPVAALALQADGSVLIGGDFTSFNGLPAARLARLSSSGALDRAFAPTVDGLVAAIVVQADGRIIIGGEFAVVDAQPRSGLARLNADGTLDPTFSADIDSAETAARGSQPIRKATSPADARKVRTLAITQGGSGQADKLLVGGAYDRLGGLLRHNLGQLILASGGAVADEGFDPGAGSDGPVNATAIQPDGKVLVGGDFKMVSGKPRRGVARLNADGTLDADFDAALQPNADGQLSVHTLLVTRGTPPAGNSVGGGKRPGVHAAEAFDGSKIYAGGSFAASDNALQQGLARLLMDKGAKDTSFDPGLGANGPVNTLTAQPDGRTVLGGHFDAVDGQPSNGVSRLLSDQEAAVILPGVTVIGASNAQEGGMKGKFLLTRDGADLSSSLTVAVRLSGTAKNGVDYQKAPEFAVIPAGAASVPFKIKPIDNAAVDGTRTVTLSLIAGDDYALGATTTDTISLLDND